MTNFKKVGVFMQVFGQNVETVPKIQELNVATLRYELINEELDELGQAIDDANIVEIADALTDLLYVVYGAGHAYGIDLDACFEEVHSSNMSKLDADGKPLYRVDGKILKGPDFREPNLTKILGV
jgi:predicted HAD superfamily Cof-like phosphohydrolase